ncbi:MAG: DUF4388 domain-containing protein [Deltaproteobacteria bacterium]|nr:DUF4388 domain-containing protein [Deltaproteobacteria bacterium]
MKLVGKIEDLGLGEILQIISFSQKSGILWLNSSKRVGSIVFRNGLVVKATSSVNTRSVGDFLAAEGAVATGTVLSAMEAQKKGEYAENLGTILINKLSVNKEIVETAAKALIEKLVVSFFFWHDGTFVFELKDYFETPEVLKTDKVQYMLSTGVNPQFMAMEGSRVHDEAMRTGVIPDDIPVGEAGVLGDETSSHDITVGVVSSGDNDSSETPVIEEPEHFQIITPELLKELEGEKLFRDIDRDKPVMIQESKGLKLLKEMLEELARPLTMSEAVLLMLRFASEIMNRAVVFAIKQGNIVGMGQFGIELTDANADLVVRKMKFPLTEKSIVADAIATQSRIVRRLDDTTTDKYIIDTLGGKVAPESYVNPVVVRGKVAFILYADNAQTNARVGDISSLEIFLAQMRIVLERMLLQKKLGGQGQPPADDEGMAV